MSPWRYESEMQAQKLGLYRANVWDPSGVIGSLPHVLAIFHSPNPDLRELKIVTAVNKSSGSSHNLTYPLTQREVLVSRSPRACVSVIVVELFSRVHGRHFEYWPMLNHSSVGNTITIHLNGWLNSPAVRVRWTARESVIPILSLSGSFMLDIYLSTYQVVQIRFEFLIELVVVFLTPYVVSYIPSGSMIFWFPWIALCRPFCRFSFKQSKETH